MVRILRFMNVLAMCSSISIWLVLVAMHVALADEFEAQQKSRFLRTVEAISEQSVEIRAEFARVALQQLALAHSLEAELAREELAASSDPQKLVGWAAAVDRFANDLTRMARELENYESENFADGFGSDFSNHLSVAFSYTGQGVVALTGTGRMIILSHPRYEQQRALEQSILKEFCARESCDSFVEIPLSSKPNIPVTTAVVKPAWNFTEEGYVCSLDGIDLVFPSDGNLRQQRMNCAAIMQEIMRLRDEVTWQVRHSVAVAWNEVSLFATPIDNEHRVQLNRAGDSILLKLPLLAANSNLLGAAIQWLRRRIELAESNVQMQFDASDLHIPPN